MSDKPAIAPLSRENNFDAIRLLMATLVIYSHSFSLAIGRTPGSNQVISLGAFGRAVFFVASGFLISLSWERNKGVGDFIRRRMARILPGFVLAFALSAWVLAPLASERPARWFTQPDLGSHLVRLGLLHHVEGDAFMGNPLPGKVNGSLWTVRFEVGMYLMVVVAGLAGLLKRRRILLAAFIAAWVVMIAAARRWIDLSIHPDLAHVISYPWNWMEFGTWYLSGVVAYAYRDKIRYDGRLAAIALAGIAWTLWRQDGSHLYIWPLAVGYLTFWFAFAPKVRLHRTTEQLGGDYSYGLFLYSFPIQQACVAWAGCAGRPLLLFLIAYPITLGLAVVSWRWVERPFLQKRKAPACNVVLAPA